MSDRDKKIILILMIIAVVALPYVFIIKDTRVATESYKAQNIELQQRLDYLRELDAQRDYFIAQTEENNKQKEEIVDSFPADIKQENYTMFLLNTEYSSAITNDDGTTELEYPIAIQNVNYGVNSSQPIYDANGNELGYTTITNVSSISYQTWYDGFKHYLEYFMDYPDPMAYTSISADFDPSTGIISGTITLAQYAIGAEGRELPAVEIAPDLDEFDLRGNPDAESGIFGSRDMSEEDAEEATTEDDETVDAEETTEKTEDNTAEEAEE